MNEPKAVKRIDGQPISPALNPVVVQNHIAKNDDFYEQYIKNLLSENDDLDSNEYADLLDELIGTPEDIICRKLSVGMVTSSKWCVVNKYIHQAFQTKTPVVKTADNQIDYDTLVVNIENLCNDYAIGICLLEPSLSHSQPINPQQSQWFRDFGKRNNGILAISPIDKQLKYEELFGRNINPSHIIYSSSVPSGNVLCFSWKFNNMKIHVEDDECMIWVKYDTAKESSMLVNILSLEAPNLLDMML